MGREWSICTSRWTLQVALQLRTKLARGRRWFVAGRLPLVFSSEYGRGLRVVLHISPAAGPLERVCEGRGDALPVSGA
jgi:hypothetical protein